MINPYFGKTFFQFCALFFQRLLEGKMFEGLASDEIQIFVLFLVAISSALIGVFLVLKQMTMLANSLSHTILLGIVSAAILTLAYGKEFHSLSLSTLFIASFITALLTVFLTGLLKNVAKLQEDASIGLVFTTLFALGIVFVTVYTRSTHVGTEAILGNVDALHWNDLKLISWVCVADFLLVLLFFKEFKVIAFDPSLAKTLGISIVFFNSLLMIQTAATAIGAFRAVGVLLVLSFLVGPALSARLLTHKLHILLPLAAIIGCVCAFLAVALSRHFLSVFHLPLSTSGLSVTLIALAYLMLLGINYRKLC